MDASAGGPRTRLGQVSHSVVLGTFNVGEQGESAVPDLSRVCLYGLWFVHLFSFLRLGLCALSRPENIMFCCFDLGHWGGFKFFWNWEPYFG